MTRCWIGLGGNQGDVATAFAAASAALSADARCRLVILSRLYRTPPMGQSAGGEFLNAAAEVETSLPPLAFLDVLQHVESQFGRVRAVHWGPRTLDLDLLLYGAAVIREPRLTVPHPGVVSRRFVLDPLAEIAPAVVHPELGRTLADLQAQLARRPFRLLLGGDDPAGREPLHDWLRATWPQVESVAEDRLADANLGVWLGASAAPWPRGFPSVALGRVDDPRPALHDILTAAWPDPQPLTR